MSNKLHFYTKYSKEKIKISARPFASGGEGAIYAIASPRTYSHLVAKIYYPEKRTEEREAKMHYLMQHPPITFQENQAPSIGWVQDLIYKGKRFIGILLIKIEGKKLTKLTLFKLPRRADKAWHRFSFQNPDALKLRLRTCFNLAVVLHQIHESGEYVLVDLKPDNVLMQPNGLLAIVDMDSVEVVKNGKALFAAPVATPEYTPPEHYLGPRGCIDVTWDYFSIGVIFYQLLLGLHPFAASCNPPYENLVSIHDKIEKGLYVHHTEKQAFFKVIPPPHKQFYSMPKEIQELFQNCFEYGGNDPLLRPSPADWCNTLADLLKLPFKKIPKVNIPPSNLYFLPSTLLKDLSVGIPKLEHKNLDSILNIENEVIPYQKLKKETLVQEVRSAYIKHLHKHRERLLQMFLVAVILSVLFFTYPIFFALGLALLVIIAPQLFFSKFQEGIDSVGRAILAKSTYELLDVDKDSSLNKTIIQAYNRSIDKMLSLKKQELQEEKALLNEKITLNPKDLDFILEHFQKRADLEQHVSTLTELVDTTEKQMLALREEEVQAYKSISDNFLAELKEDPSFKKYKFRSFSILRMRITQEINGLKGKISILEKPLKELELEHQRKLEKLKSINSSSVISSYKKQLDATTLKELIAFKKENDLVGQHKTDYWDFTQQKKELQNHRHQQKQKAKRQPNDILQKIQKELGLKSKADLNAYFNLLNDQQEEELLDFAPSEIQKQFRVFAKQIETLNIKQIFSSEVINILNQPLPKVSFDKPKKAKNIKTLTSYKNNMINTWEINQSKVKLFDAALKKLAQNSENHTDPIELAYWSKTSKELLSDIIFNLNQYTEIQEIFYGDPIIFRLKNRLDKYNKQTQEVQQQIKNVDKAYFDDLQRLEEKHKTLIEQQENLEFLKETQNALIEKKDKALQLATEQEVLKHTKQLEAEEQKQIKDQETSYRKDKETIHKSIKHSLTPVSFQLKETERKLEKLNTAFVEFEQSIEKVRTDKEATYTNNRLLLEEKLNIIKTLVDEIHKEHPSVSQKIRQNHTYYQNQKPLISAYQENFNQLNQLQNDKIRIDALSEWQNAYDSKIYIKDLLLNKVEQLEKYEEKKK